MLSVLFDFNSIKVQLEHPKWATTTLTFPNFNSIKVQLEPLDKLYRLQQQSFQFHKGTIRTTGFDKVHGQFCSFQFHKGTIRTGIS